MNSSCVAFKLCNKVDKSPVGHTNITCHLIFDLKLDMTCKAQYVAGGNLNDFPTYMNYSSVVSHDTACIVLLMDDLNNLDVLAGGIQNALLEAPVKENIFFYEGYKRKADKYKVVIVVRALYGIESSSLQFRNCLAENLGNQIGYKSYLDDPEFLAHWQ